MKSYTDIPRNEFVSGKTAAAITTTTSTAVIAAKGTGVQVAVLGIMVTNAHATQGTKVTILDGTTAKLTGYADAKGGFIMNGNGAPLFVGTANTAINAKCGTTGVDVEVFIQAVRLPV